MNVSIKTNRKAKSWDQGFKPIKEGVVPLNANLFFGGNWYSPNSKNYYRVNTGTRIGIAIAHEVSDGGKEALMWVKTSDGKVEEWLLSSLSGIFNINF
jgi:hypothetical protein